MFNMTNKKPTKKMNYEAIKKLLANANRPDLIDFCDHEIELLDNRNSADRNTEGKRRLQDRYCCVPCEYSYSQDGNRPYQRG